MEKMIGMKSKMSFNDLEKKLHYANILALLREFGEKESGLRQAHLRYVLMKNPKLHWYTVRDMKEFFGDELEEAFKPLPLLKKPFLSKGCISSRQQLTNFLDKLLEMGVIEKHGKRPNVRYKLTRRYRAETERTDVIDRVNWWDGRYIIQMREKKFTLDSREGFGSLTLFGLLEQTYSVKEMEIIQECLENILDNARKILEIKFKRMQVNISMTKWFQKAKQSIMDGEDHLKKETELSSFCLFYKGQIWPFSID